ncbi:MAG: hypothetical protein AAGG11_14665 [Pseudomonadota bacterium]
MTTSKKRAQDRRSELLDCARQILLSEGARALTLRGIATAVGLKLASIQYYFPTHAALITALVEDRLEQQQAAIQRLSATTVGDARQTLDAVLRFWTLDSDDTADDSRLDVQFWALAETDGTAKHALNRYHELYVTFLAELIRSALGITRRRATARAVAIASLLEGSVLFVDLSDESAPGYHRYQDLYRSVCLLAYGEG